MSDERPDLPSRPSWWSRHKDKFFVGSLFILMLGQGWSGLKNQRQDERIEQHSEWIDERTRPERGGPVMDVGAVRQPFDEEIELSRTLSDEDFLEVLGMIMTADALRSIQAFFGGRGLDTLSARMAAEAFIQRASVVFEQRPPEGPPPPDSSAGGRASG